MSTLFTPERSGLYRTPADAAKLRDAALAAGTVWIDLRLDQVTGKAGLLKELAESIGFGPHFGGNWDALADSLQDLPRAARGGYVLRLIGGAPARQRLGDIWNTAFEILDETAMYWRARGKTFVTFIDDAPELPEWK